MFVEIEIKRADPERDPLKCFVHASVATLVNIDDPNDINEMISYIYSTLPDIENIDGVVVNTSWGPVLVRDHDNGGISLYAAILPNHQNIFTEAINRSRLDRVMLKRGFVPCPPIFDVGIDCIYYREIDNTVRLTQLKSRAGIWKKYQDRNIWLAFMENNDWYLYPHDNFIDFCKTENKWLHTPSWKDKGHYHVSKIQEWMRPFMARWKFEN